jgi:hypothetical protein
MKKGDSGACCVRPKGDDGVLILVDSSHPSPGDIDTWLPSQGHAWVMICSSADLEVDQDTH